MRADLDRPSFRERLDAGEQLIGMIVTLSDPAVTEIMAQAGFDFLWFDGEHSVLDVAMIQALAQAAGAAHCLARVPTLDEAWAKKTLEIGIDGVVFPLVNNQELAKRVVALSKYPPLGNRSVGVARAQSYGPGFNRYLETANDRICTIVQIEHIAGVHNVQSILAVPGVDALMIGPYDLSASMGVPGKVDAPEVKAAIDRIHQAGQAAGRPVGIFAGSVGRARQFLQEGFNFVAVAIDVMLLADLAGDIAHQLK